MNLQYFPMDRQLCHIEIESCEYHSHKTNHQRANNYSTTNDYVVESDARAVLRTVVEYQMSKSVQEIAVRCVGHRRHTERAIRRCYGGPQTAHHTHSVIVGPTAHTTRSTFDV